MERRTRTPYMPPETDIPSINAESLAAAAATKVQQEQSRNAQIEAKLSEAYAVIDARGDDPIVKEAMKVAAREELAETINPSMDPFGRGEKKITREFINQEKERIRPVMEAKLMAETRYISASDEDKAEMLSGLTADIHEKAVERALNGIAGMPVNTEDLEKHFTKTNRARFRDFDKEALDAEGYEIIKVPSQLGSEVEYYWPKSAEKKVDLLRQIMNEVEENYTQDFGTSQTAIQEIYAVIPLLQASARADLKEVGDLMFEEFRWRYTFLQTYSKFAFATDSNAVIESIASLGNSLLNFYKRDSHAAYAQSTLENSSLPIMTVYRWVDKNIESILRLPESEHDDYIESQLTSYFRDTLHKDKNQLSDVTLKSAILNGRRIWEIERLGKKDFLINRTTRAKFEIYSTDEAIRKRAWDSLYEEAAKGNVEWLGKLENKRLARETYSPDLHMYVQANALQIKTYRFEGKKRFDGNNREMMSTLPGDIYEMLEAKLKNQYSKNTGYIDESTGDKAVYEAIQLTQAITGLEAKIDDEGRPKWPGRTSAEPVDITKWAHSISELDNLVHEGYITEAEKQNRIQTLLNVLGPEVKLENNKFVAVDPAIISDRTLFLLGNFNSGLFGYNQPEGNYGNKSQRYVGGAKKFYDDNALGGHDCYGRKNTLSVTDGVKMLQSLNYLRAGQGDQQKTMALNFAAEQKASGLIIGAESRDALLANLFKDVAISEKNTQEAYKMVEQSIYYDVFAAFGDYTGLPGWLKKFFQGLLMEIIGKSFSLPKG